MSSEYLAFLQASIVQVYRYGGLFTLVTGIVGELFNILIFTTLKTFRRTTCGFYLTFLSISNFGQIITAVLIRTLNYGFRINLIGTTWTCKLRECFVHFFALASFTLICLATIDQFLSLVRPHWNNLYWARWHILLIGFVWLGHNVPFLIYCDIVSNQCRNLNATFYYYVNYVIWPVFLGCLPIFIMIIFSSLAFYHVRKLNGNHRGNLFRQSQDRQLTSMTLVYVLFIVVLSTPCIIFSIYTLDLVNLTAEQSIINRLIYTILSALYYQSYAVRFCFFAVG